MNQTLVDLLERNLAHAEAFEGRFDDVQDGQRPDAVTVCCSDSRVLQDGMWDNDRPGQLFTCANIGNRVVQRTPEGEVVSGDVLYPIAHTGTELAIVVGHTGCGAVTATYDQLTEGLSEPPGIEHSIGLLAPRLQDGVEALPDGIDRETAINRLVEYNVDRQVELLVESDDVPDSVTAVGVVYDFQDVYGGRRGEVHVVNVDGTRAVDALRRAHPDLADRVNRLWEYDR
ncbi:Carbonic anhydrase [Halapricum desulfuricans]|uniref:carbonic anhydrase n=1 Tax=Halapricum desulfuricans TaxID=2841257 RepID=A0A897NEX9_9EURY|nr:carbonic anhydrase [Halapricum desulfuricans]QSG11237.1 Carbonic anhydrase [Halapricum desulfuricans]